MAWLIPILLLAWPFAEIALFVSVADWIGWLPAIGLILLSGVVGAALLSGQNFASALGMRQSLRETPGEGLFDQASRALAGLLFLMPGFMTDLLALGLLLPPVRRMAARAVLGRQIRTAPASHDRPRPGTVIDGDFTVVEEDPGNPPDDHNGRLPGR